jgi:hypothetical protein
MSYAKIDSKIWNDERFHALPSEAKLIFLYLITTEKRSTVGVIDASKPIEICAELGYCRNPFEMVSKQFGNGFETVSEGFDNNIEKSLTREKDIQDAFAECQVGMERLRNGFETLSKSGLIIREGSFILLPAFMKYHEIPNPNVLKMRLIMASRLPEGKIKSFVVWTLFEYSKERFNDFFVVGFEKAFKQKWDDVSIIFRNSFETVSKLIPIYQYTNVPIYQDIKTTQETEVNKTEPKIETEPIADPVDCFSSFGELSVALRKAGVNATSMNPLVQAMHREKITRAESLEVLERCKLSLQKETGIALKYFHAVFESYRREATKPVTVTKGRSSVGDHNARVVAEYLNDRKSNQAGA